MLLGFLHILANPRSWVQMLSKSLVTREKIVGIEPPIVPLPHLGCHLVRGLIQFGEGDDLLLEQQCHILQIAAVGASHFGERLTIEVEVEDIYGPVAPDKT